MATIHIKNLGPIQNINFEIKNFNLFIGEQAAGKSTICKAIYFFRLLKESLIGYLYSVAVNGPDDDNNKFPSVMNWENKHVFINIFGPSWNLPKNLEMTYVYSDIITIKVILSSEGYLDVKYEKGIDKIKKLERDMEQYYKKRSKQMSAKKTNETMRKFIGTEDIRLYNELNQQISNIFDDNMETYYIPAGRSLLSLMGDLLQPTYPISNATTTSVDDELRYNTLDFINRRFIDIVRSSRNKFSNGLSNVYKFYEKKDKLYTDILPSDIISSFKGEYFFNDKIEYIALENGHKVPINFASSGQQEILWLFNLLYMWLLQGEKAFIIIEEPEAHLHPTLQHNVMKFIAEFANLTGSTILLTTHSPYILTSTNLLLYGGKLTKKDKKGVASILGTNKYIYPQESNIFEITQQSNHTRLHSLKDDNYLESLEVEKLDKISDTINEQYTELVYLENDSEWSKI